MYHYAFFHLLYLRADGLAAAGIRRLVVTSATATTATAGCSQQATLRSQVAPEAFQPLPSREQSGHKQGLKDSACGPLIPATGHYQPHKPRFLLFSGAFLRRSWSADRALNDRDLQTKPNYLDSRFESLEETKLLD